jgi:hypothetical protein
MYSKGSAHTCIQNYLAGSSADLLLGGGKILLKQNLGGKLTFSDFREGEGMDLTFLFNGNIKTHRNGQTVLENMGSIRATAPCEVIQSIVFLQSSGQISCSVPYSMFFAMMYQACAPVCVCVCVGQWSG